MVDRAPLCPLLLYACLAISARHLCHTTKSVPPHVADEYHERCIAILLPVLENKDYNISIEILLASTVILRFFEQISCACYCDFEKERFAANCTSSTSFLRPAATPASRIRLHQLARRLRNLRRPSRSLLLGLRHARYPIRTSLPKPPSTDL